MSDPTKEPLRRRTKVLLVLGALLAIALIAAALVAWRRRVEAMKPRLLEHADPVTALAFTPRGDEIVTVAGEPYEMNTVTCWEEPEGRLRLKRSLPTEATSIDIAPAGGVMAYSDTGGGFARLALADGSSVGTPVRGAPRRTKNDDSISAYSVVRFSPSGARAAANGLWGSLQVWSLEDGKNLVALRDRGPSGSLEPLADCYHVFGFLSEDQVAFMGAGALKVWSVAKDAVVLELPCGFDGWSHNYVSPRTTLWVSCPWNGMVTGEKPPFTANVRRLPGGEKVGPIVRGPAGAILAFSHDDALLAIADSEAVTIQTVATGTVVFTQPLAAEKGADVRAVAFSPVADRVAVACGKKVFVFPFVR